MARATWKGVVIAESADPPVVEGNVYFPPGAVDHRFLRPSAETSVCGWKGVARYHDVVVGDAVNPGAAWYYPDPKPAAKAIAHHIAFWRGVRVER